MTRAPNDPPHHVARNNPGMERSPPERRHHEPASRAAEPKPQPPERSAGHIEHDRARKRASRRAQE